VGSYKIRASPPTVSEDIEIHVRDQEAQTYSLDAFLTRNFAGQFDGITSGYSTSFVTGLDLLSDKRLRRCNKYDLSGRKPTVNWEKRRLSQVIWK